MRCVDNVFIATSDSIAISSQHYMYVQHTRQRRQSPQLIMLTILQLSSQRALHLEAHRSPPTLAAPLLRRRPPLRPQA